MPFVEVPGLKGKVYIPEEHKGSVKKHPCKDCYSCQLCSDDRCALCLGPKNCSSQKSSEK